MMLCKKPIFGKFGCGQCMPCRFNRRNIWASRIMLEEAGHHSASFLTLTYSEDFVPKTDDGKYNLEPDHLRKFWMKLRNRFDGIKLRYYAVGEYGHEGERQWNPHYHAALFGINCLGKDLRPDTGYRCHCEVCLRVESAWSFGNITLDELTPQSANYIAGYIEKKMTNPADTRLEGRHPEFSRQSGGIGKFAVQDITEVILGEFGDQVMCDGDVPISLKRGDKTIPLGRYIRSKIRQDLDLYKVDPESGEITYGAPHETLRIISAKSSPEVYALQEGLRNGSEDLQAYKKIEDLRNKKRLKVAQKVKNFEARVALYQGEKKL